jgi:hypothetical protein
MPMSDQAMLAVHSPALGWVTLIVSWSAEGVTVSDVPSPSSSGWFSLRLRWSRLALR